MLKMSPQQSDLHDWFGTRFRPDPIPDATGFQTQISRMVGNNTALSQR